MFLNKESNLLANLQVLVAIDKSAQKKTKFRISLNIFLKKESQSSTNLLPVMHGPAQKKRQIKFEFE